MGSRVVVQLYPRPLNTAMDLGRIARGLGAEAWAVVPDSPDFPGELDEREWGRIIRAPNDAREIARLIRGARGDVRGILASEHTVGTAEEAARELGLPGNDPATSDLRWHKGATAKALAVAGVPCPATFPVATLEQALAAGRKVGYPPERAGVAFKLANSCAGEKFAACRSPRELEAAWRVADGTRNLLGRISEPLVQELLPGDVSFTANTVTLCGRHWVPDAWRDVHIPASAAYDRSDLLSPRDPAYRRFAGHLRGADDTPGALDVLGYRWGPGHIEARLTADDRLCIHDETARFGGWYQGALNMAGLTGQAEAAVLAAMDPEALRAWSPDPPETPGAVTLLWMIVPEDGMFIDNRVLGETLRLPGVRGIIDPQPGDARFRLAGAGPLGRTTTLANQPGAWVIAHERPDITARTAETIRHTMEHMLYRRPP